MQADTDLLFEAAIRSLDSVCSATGSVGTIMMQYFVSIWGVHGEASRFEREMWAHVYRPAHIREQYNTNNLMERSNRVDKEDLTARSGLVPTAEFLSEQLKIQQLKLDDIESGALPPARPKQAVRTRDTQAAIRPLVAQSQSTDEDGQFERFVGRSAQAQSARRRSATERVTAIFESEYNVRHQVHAAARSLLDRVGSDVTQGEYDDVMVRLHMTELIDQYSPGEICDRLAAAGYAINSRSLRGILAFVQQWHDVRLCSWRHYMHHAGTSARLDPLLLLVLSDTVSDLTQGGTTVRLLTREGSLVNYGRDAPLSICMHYDELTGAVRMFERDGSVVLSGIGARMEESSTSQLKGCERIPAAERSEAATSSGIASEIIDICHEVEEDPDCIIVSVGKKRSASSLQREVEENARRNPKAPRAKRRKIQ